MRVIGRTYQWFKAGQSGSEFSFISFSDSSIKTSSLLTNFKSLEWCQWPLFVTQILGCCTFKNTSKYTFTVPRRAPHANYSISHSDTNNQLIKTGNHQFILWVLAYNRYWINFRATSTPTLHTSVVAFYWFCRLLSFLGKDLPSFSLFRWVNVFQANG